MLVHTGWCTKQGHVIKNWKRRFVRLTVNRGTHPKQATLCYYKEGDAATLMSRPGRRDTWRVAAASHRLGCG
jgi:hypothetical protein